MGSQIILEEEEQRPFRLALHELREKLKEEGGLSDMVRAGVVKINLISDHLESGEYRSLFHYALYMRWVKEQNFGRHTDWPDRAYELCQRYELLRTALNTPSIFGALAAIGPCGLSIWDPTDLSQRDVVSIGIHNWVGRTCMPNYDYELTSDGEVVFTG